MTANIHHSIHLCNSNSKGTWNRIVACLIWAKTTHSASSSLFNKWEDALKGKTPYYALVDRQCNISYLVNMLYIIMSQSIKKNATTSLKSQTFSTFVLFRKKEFA